MAGMRLARRRFTAVAFAMLLVTLAACSGVGPPGQAPAVDVITPLRAERVVHDYWSSNEQALMTYNTDLLTKVQASPLLEATTAEVKGAKAADDPPLKSPRPLEKVTVYVPHQQAFPAQFVGQLQTVRVDSAGKPTQDPMGLYYRFLKSADGAPWKANFYVLATLDHVPNFAVGKDGYAKMLAPDDRKFVIGPKQLPGSLASYLNSGVTSGSPQGPFAPGHLTTDAVTALRRYRDGMGKLGYTVDLKYQPGQFLDAYAGNDGRAIVLFNLQSMNKIAVPDGLHCIVQSKDNLHRWGGLVPPGSYSQLVEDRLLQFVATVPAKKAGTAIDVPAYVETQVSAETSPADPACH